ncbi:integrator complex subunit 2 [Phascolomyces articulosus]|uniref:Integrator complex subunit 2 n=1 Tax=Phascolomyces articulosus TaxID=60185 RepID=A0AAD5K9Z4_9FUNG|nr:integrator complex subunit 2 [Phascolomyces articulosus]
MIQSYHIESILSQRRENPSKVISVLSYVENMENVNVSPYAKLCISHLLKPCLGTDMDQDITEALVSTWESLNLIIPHEVWVMTANALRDESIKMEYSFDTIISDPLSLFKCDRRVFRSETILPVWLHYLGCVRICSKHRIWKRFHTHRNAQINTRNVNALVNGQDSAMVQLLLEACIPTEADKESPDTLKIVQRLICQFVHGLFIDGDRDMLLAKILHFQTYSIELLPVVVEFIPSLFAVFNFIPELLRQPQPDKQVFGILLACHLCEKYPLENYLRTAENHILPRLLKIAFPSVPPSSVCAPSEYLVQVIPGFVHLAKAYPHFGSKILQVFDEIARGLPPPQEFVGQEGNSKIILVLRLHQVLNSSRESVQYEVDHSIKVEEEDD